MRRDLCFHVALKEEGGLYNEASSINKVNKKYSLLLSKYITEEDMFDLERRAFQNV